MAASEASPETRPGASSGETGDFRHRICKRFAALVEQRTNGSLRFEIYLNASLMKSYAEKTKLAAQMLKLAGEVPA